MSDDLEVVMDTIDRAITALLNPLFTDRTESLVICDDLNYKVRKAFYELQKEKEKLQRDHAEAISELLETIERE